MHHFYRHIRSVEGHAPRGKRHTGNYGHHASHRVPGDRFSSRGMDSDRKWMDRFGEWLREKVGGKNDSQFVEGFVSASLVICVGAMAIVGALEDGMRGDYSMLAAKAVLDAVIVMVFASSYGKGAVFSALPVGLWQGGITIFAGFLEPVLTPQIVSDLPLPGMC